jgi:hypothetical protein
MSESGEIVSKKKAKKGRPTKTPVPGERASLGLKVTAEIKARLDRSAQESGRTQSQEAEFRLERSFDRSDLLSEALVLEFGKGLAGVVRLLGSVMIFAEGAHRAHHSSSPNRALENWTWGSDPSAYEEAVLGAMAVLEALRPEGVATVQSSYGLDMADALIKRVRGDSDAPKNPFTEDAPEIRSLLGPLAKRLRTAGQSGNNLSALSVRTRFCPRCEMPVSANQYGAILSEVHRLVAKQMSAGLPLVELMERLCNQDLDRGCCPLCYQIYNPRVDQNIVQLVNGCAAVLEAAKEISATEVDHPKARGQEHQAGVRLRGARSDE